MIVSPSLLAACSARYGEEVAVVEKAGAEYLHIDVMDGAFVPNLSFGPNIVEGIRPLSKLYFDVHLMIYHPENFLLPFIKAGADCITVHLEATDKIREIRDICRQHNVDFGISISPDTPVCAISPYKDIMNLLLIMSIYPGIPGQQFMPEAAARIREGAKIRETSGANFLISVDGGINPATAGICRAAGADIVVAGRSVFSAPDPKAIIDSLKNSSSMR